MNKMANIVNFIKALGLRKWSVMLLVLFIGTNLLISGTLNGDQYVDLVKDVCVAFMATNSLEYISKILPSNKDKD